MLRVYACITDQHDLRLVIVAGLICLFSCFTAFSMLDRAATTHGPFRYSWFAAVALVTGCGVWTTHFVAMLAFMPGLPVAYDLGLTALSIFVAIGFSAVGFLAFLDWKRPLLGGATVGLAIGAMHFVGMGALDVPAHKNWDPAYVVAALLIGLSLGAAALTVRQHSEGLRGRSFGAVLLTLGICGMHFVAMAALSFTPDPLILIPEQRMPSELLGTGVVGVALFIVGAGFAGSIVDQHLARRSAFEAERLRQHVAALEATAKALRNSEERIRGIAQNLPGFLFQCFVTADDTISLKLIGSRKFDLNAEAAEWSQNHREVTLNFIFDQDRAGLSEVILAAHKGETDWERTFRIVTSDGSRRWVRAIARRTNNAQTRGVWDGIALDETERIEAEEQNTQLQIKLRQAEKMESLGTLAGGVAHEINNLLQPIIMMTELTVAELPNDSGHRKRLERVVDAGSKAAEIVQRILAFGRVDEASHDALDISLLTREAVIFVRTILPSTITLHVDIKGINGGVRGDRTQLTQVLINLVSNARDAIGGKVGTVWLTLSRVDIDRQVPPTQVGTLRKGAYAMITIKDTGTGMDEPTIRKIFEPFFTTKSVGKGTGLGLSVTHGIIVGHGGAISVESALGSGTTISIYLPIEKTIVPIALAS